MSLWKMFSLDNEWKDQQNKNDPGSLEGMGLLPSENPTFPWFLLVSVLYLLKNLKCDSNISNIIKIFGENM